MDNSKVDILEFYRDLSEEQTAKEFDDFIESTKLFICEKEVPGQYLFGHNGMSGQTARIDRILIPKSDVSKERGLITGPIGIEIKADRPTTRWGPPICQAINYRSAAFRLFNGWANIDCILDSVFLFPMAHNSGPIESIMAQHRVGSAFIGYGDTMIFQMSSTHVLRLNRGSQKFTFNMKTYSTGRKYGSR